LDQDQSAGSLSIRQLPVLPKTHRIRKSLSFDSLRRKVMKIQFDSEFEEVIIDGARISLQVLATLVNSDPMRYYRFLRLGSTVYVNSYSTQAEADSAFTAGFRPVL
jgi:hypothetical protein